MAKDIVFDKDRHEYNLLVAACTILAATVRHEYKLLMAACTVLAATVAATNESS